MLFVLVCLPCVLTSPAGKHEEAGCGKGKREKEKEKEREKRDRKKKRKREKGGETVYKYGLNLCRGNYSSLSIRLI